MKKLLIALIAIMLVGSLILGGCAKAPSPAPTPSPAPAQPIKLVFTTHEMGAPNFFATDILGPWCDEVEKRSGGRVQIERHWGGQLVSVMDEYDAAAKGTVDIANFIGGMVTGRFDMDQVVYFTQYNHTCWRPSQAYWELYKAFPEMQAQYNDTKVIALFCMFQRGILSTTKPIRKLEDFKGLKMLASGKWSGLRWQALGAVPTSVPPGESYTSLQKGVIDATPCPLYLLRDWKEGEVGRYLDLVVTSTPYFGIAMNLNTFNKLPADIQKIVVDSGEWLVGFLDDAQLKVDKEREISAHKEFPQIEWITVPKEELDRWVAVDTPVLDQLVNELESKGMPGKKLRDEFLKLEAKYSAAEYAPK